MDKNKFGQIFSCLPYLPLQKVWTFWKESLLLNSYLHGMYWGIMKILIIREAFKLRLSLRMTLNNENPFQTTAKRSSSSPYLEITILLYKYGLLYLPTYNKSLSPNFIFWKKFGWRIPYLPTVWTYVQNSVCFFWDPLLIYINTEVVICRDCS